EDLPRDLHEALEYLEKDEVVRAALGDHIYERFIEAKQREWQEYIGRVSEWELERYLGLYWTTTNAWCVVRGCQRSRTPSRGSVGTCSAGCNHAPLTYIFPADTMSSPSIQVRDTKREAHLPVLAIEHLKARVIVAHFWS